MNKEKIENGVRAKLEAFRKLNEGERTVTLRQSGVACTIPNFINHDLWMRAQRAGASDTALAQTAFIAEAVRFEGEKLSLTDIRELVPARDMIQLIAAVFDRQDRETVETEGNTPPELAA